MRIVEPIRDLNRIQRIKGNLKRKKNPLIKVKKKPGLSMFQTSETLMHQNI